VQPQSMGLRLGLSSKTWIERSRSIATYSKSNPTRVSRAQLCQHPAWGQYPRSGAIGKLPDADGYFPRSRMTQERGLGVEVVLEVDDVQQAYQAVRAAAYPIHESLQARPWGLTDFRLADPDGYYLRVTSRQEH
jgi:hypothetical protein